MKQFVFVIIIIEKSQFFFCMQRKVVAYYFGIERAREFIIEKFFLIAY